PVNYPSKAKIAVEINAAAKPSIPNLARIIRFAHWRGVRIILRIPCFHDPWADKKPKDGRLSLKNPVSGQPIHIDWLDPTGTEAEVIMPMVYPSHYDKGYNGWEHPGDHPEIVGIGTKGAVAQLKKANASTVVRSWLQAFPWRTNVFSAKYVVDQAKSAESNG